MSRLDTIRVDDKIAMQTVERVSSSVGHTYILSRALPAMRSTLLRGAPYSRGMAALALAGASSSDEEERRYGYDCLSRLLERAPTKQHEALLLSLRDAIGTPNEQLPASTATFVAHSLGIMSR